MIFINSNLNQFTDTMQANKMNYNHSKLRSSVVEKLRNNIEKFGRNGNNYPGHTNEQWVGPYIEDDYPYTEYLSKMEKQSEWADNIMIQVPHKLIYIYLMIDIQVHRECYKKKTNYCKQRRNEI